MTYSGLFVRGSLAQTPTQDPDGWSASPDIILYGLKPAKDPKVFVADYGTDYGSTVHWDRANYVYLRALNTAAGALAGRAWFYHAPADLMLWPRLWQASGVAVHRQHINHAPIAARTGGEVCVAGPLVWTPVRLTPPFPTDGAMCAIVWMEDAPLHPPGWTPQSGNGDLSTLEQLADFICGNPNMAWRNSVDVSQAGPTWRQTTAITGPAAGGQFLVGVACSNMPTGALVSYSIPGSGDVPPVEAKNIPIWGPGASPMTTVTWPPNHSSTITVTYNQGQAEPPTSGAALAACVSVQVNTVGSSALRQARQAQPWRFRTARMVDHSGTYGGTDDVAVIIGSAPYQF